MWLESSNSSVSKMFAVYDILRSELFQLVVSNIVTAWIDWLEILAYKVYVQWVYFKAVFKIHATHRIRVLLLDLALMRINVNLWMANVKLKIRMLCIEVVNHLLRRVMALIRLLMDFAEKLDKLNQCLQAS